MEQMETRVVTDCKQVQTFASMVKSTYERPTIEELGRIVDRFETSEFYIEPY